MTFERLRGEAPGPTLLIVAGLHGNEPAGVEACRRVLERLAERPLARGEIVPIVANPAALEAGRRFLVRDLNRQWTPERIAAARAALKAAGAGVDAETAALAEMADRVDAAFASARGPMFALDLHTTSAAGLPFAIVRGAEAELAFARELVVPAVTGLAERTAGTLTGYLAERGCLAVAIEGGQHEAPATVAHLEAVLRLALVACGLAAADDVGGCAEGRALLERTRGGLPPVIEAVTRHAVRPGGGFVMEPGFANIHRTAEGTLLAREDGEEIRAACDGFVLLPLYQAQGDDGFFYGIELSG